MIFGKPLFQSGAAGSGTVGELLAAFDHLAEFCTAVGAKAPAKELALFAQALKPHSERTVGEFCSALREGLSRLAQKPAARKKSLVSAKATAVNSALMSQHLAALRNAGADRHAFDLALTNLKDDKSLKSPDVTEIARQYGLTVTKYKSIAAAHADIEKAFIRHARLNLS